MSNVTDKWIDVKRERWLFTYAESFVPDGNPQTFVDHVRRNKWLMSHNTNPNFETDLYRMTAMVKDSPLHKKMDYLLLMKYLVYPLLYKQAIVESQSYITWGMFESNNVLDLYLNTTFIPTDPSIVTSGNEAWGIDVVSKNGKFLDVIIGLHRWFQDTGKTNKYIHFVRRYPSGKKRVTKWSLRHKDKYGAGTY